MIVVVQTPTQSFISGTSDLLVNGKKPEPTPGLSSWYFIDGKVEKIEKQKVKSGSKCGYELGEEYKQFATKNIRKEISIEEHQNLPEGVQDWYISKYTPSENYLEPVEFQIYETEESPIAPPIHCNVEFPSCFSVIPNLWYTCPCTANKVHIFPLVKKAIAEHVEKHKNLYSLTEYSNIQTITVNRKVLIPESMQKVEIREYTPWGGRRKVKEKVKHTTKSVKVFTINGDYKSSYEDYIQVPNISAKNYRDLKEKIDEYIEGLIKLLDTEVVCVCEACKGSGIIQKKSEQ